MAKHNPTVAERFTQWANQQGPTANWEDIIGEWEDDGGGSVDIIPAEVVLAEIVDTTRWAVIHRQVFRMRDNSHVQVHWKRGATEYQDQDPECEWTVVYPHPVTVVEYREERPDA